MNTMCQQVVLCFLLGTLLTSHIHAEIFTSMADMEQMVTFEKEMLKELNKYILEEENKLKEIKNFMLNVNEALRSVNTSEDVGKYLGNPINSYLMLKRFNVDWKNLEKMLEVDFSESLNKVFDNLKPFFPTSEDHEGAMDALLRLQRTYKLQSNSLADGVIPGVSQFSAHALNVDDIFELGTHAYKKKNWPYAIQWLTTALGKLDSRTIAGNTDKSDVMDHLAYALFQYGEIRKAYKFTAELAKLRPHDQRIIDNLEYFQREMKHLESAKRGDLGGEVGTKQQDEVTSKKSYTLGDAEERAITMKAYEKLCRGEARELTKREKLKLKCWYRQTNPVLRLKPQKVERLWVNPEILRFYDFVEETQSKWIKETAYPLLKRATIQDPATGKLRHAHYRVSKSAWLSPVNSVVRKLATRAEAITGLDMGFAEHLQIANYGIGGHYEPHFDHARDGEDKFTELNMGNRIATILIYTSDVKAGGPTVFTNAHAVVYPVKNSAVFWYNLKRNGEGNTITRHAACPVLVGQKWVSNWWIHEYGQVFRRPCALNENW